MSIYHRSSEKRRIYHEFRRQEEEVIGSLCRLGSRPISPKTQLEQEKRIRREIANSNERRRMQSINAGFQSLRNLLPHHEGEKLSKAAILQQTADFIYQLEQDKTRLLSQNSQLKRLLNNQLSQDSDGSLDSPLPKRKKAEIREYTTVALPLEVIEAESKCWKTQTAESSDEGIGNMSPKEGTEEDLRREVQDLRLQLERERRLRRMLEDEHPGAVEVQHVYEKTHDIQHYRYQEDDEAFIEEKPTVEYMEEENECPVSPHAVDLLIPDEALPQDLSGKPAVVVQQIAVPTEASVVVHNGNESNTVHLHVLGPSVPYEESGDVIGEEVVVLTNDPQNFPIGSQPARIYPASTSRQNLETIVEAIRHLEGDHMFCDDPEPIASVEITSTPLEDEDEEATSVAIPSGGHEYAIRQQVIHCSTNGNRPGVIVVANHT